MARLPVLSFQFSVSAREPRRARDHPSSVQRWTVDGYPRAESARALFPDCKNQRRCA